MLIAVISIVLAAAAAVFAFFSPSYATALAFLAMCVAGLMPEIHITPAGYLCWGVAMVISVALEFMLPGAVARSRRGVPYMAGAAMAGAFAGLAIGSQAAIVIGAVAGAAFGGIAYGRTPAGSVLQFPSSRFVNYLCAKGLPAAVAMSLCALTAALLITYL